MIPPQIADRSRLPRMGVIRLGIKVPLVRDGKPAIKNGEPVTIPSEVDYFVLPDTLRALLGAEPKTLRVLFPFDDPAHVLTANYTRYSGALLTLRCDGRNYVELPREGGAELVGVCRRRADEAECVCGAKPKGRLHVIVIDGPVGVYQVLIGGAQRIADLWNQLHVFARVFGRLTEIPFTLERIATEVQIRREDGSRLAKTGWPVTVRCNFTVMDALKARGRDLTALPSLIVDDPDDHDDPDEPAALPAAPPIDPVADEPWTIERCYAAAKALGIEAKPYAMYLLHRYKSTDIDLADIAQQTSLLTDLAEKPTRLAEFKAHLETLAPVRR
jgi:hypothetical protein